MQNDYTVIKLITWCGSQTVWAMWQVHNTWFASQRADSAVDTIVRAVASVEASPAQLRLQSMLR